MAEFKTVEVDLEVNALIESRRLSFKETHNDILRRCLLDDRQSPRLSVTALADAVAEAGERTTGRWTVEFAGQRVAAPNLKGAYRTLLLLLARHDRHFLFRFSKEKARSRRYVARSPEQLYLASPGLAKQHAKPLTDGWYFDTNLSTDQVARRIRIAARLCGLKYGSEVRLLNNLEEI